MSEAPPEISLELVTEAQRGKPDALRELVEHTYPIVRRWALVQTGDPAESDDLTQDVLIQMIQKLDTFKAEARFESWMYSMVRNVATDRFRKERRVRRIAADPRAPLGLVPLGAPDPARLTEARETRAVLDVFFLQLPIRQREIFDLVELQGYTASEAARIMGVEPVTVRAHLFKARKRLRARILEDRPDILEEIS